MWCRKEGLNGKGRRGSIKVGGSWGHLILIFVMLLIGHVKDVVMAVFQYLEMVRREGPQLWIFQECAVSQISTSKHCRS